MSRTFVLASFAFLVSGCSLKDASDAPVEAPVVYGNDDRLEYYAASAELQRLTRESIVALVRPSAIDDANPNAVRLEGLPLGTAYSLCASERYRDQPTAAHCSGTLIDSDLVLTAGHCVETAADCANTRLVFDYYYTGAGTLSTISLADDVYSCRRLLVQRLEVTSNGRSYDYAVLQLDRPVASEHVPAPITTVSGAVTMAAPVTIVGFGSGLPCKVDSGGRITDVRAAQLDFFRATTDSFGGNSGSGVFDANRTLIGILVRGEEDYVARGGCNVVNVLSNNQPVGRGEQISYAYGAVQALCATGWSSERVCGRSPTCGDGTCAGGETPASCPADCAAPSCGDGVCDAGETTTSCAADCDRPAMMVPASWVCPPGYYGRLEGCDCECGARDPDCNVTGQAIYGCEAGQTCDANGACAGTPLVVPPSWQCDPDYFGTRDGCDCECGAIDPDCSVPGQEVLGCANGEVCPADECIPAPDAGTSDAGVDAGAPIGDDAGRDGGSGPDAGTASRTDVGPGAGSEDAGVTGASSSSSGCGCRAPFSRVSAPTMLPLLLAVVLAGRRARRRSR